MKLKLNRQGNIIFSFMVVILILTSIYITSTVVIAHRYQSVVMYNKVREQYLAESLVDIQRGLLKTKLSNTSVEVMFSRVGAYGGEDYDYIDELGNTVEATGFEAQTSVYLFDGYEIEEISTGDNETTEQYIPFTDIVAESMEFLRNEKDMEMKNFISNMDSELRLIYPSTREGLRISNICLDTKFWVDLDNWGLDDNTEKSGKLDKLLFESVVYYKGGKISTLFEVDNIYFVRNLFKHDIIQNVDGTDEDFGTTEAWVDTSNMTINVIDYDIIPDSGGKK